MGKNYRDRTTLEALLQRFHGRTSHVAKFCNVKPSTIIYWCKRHGITYCTDPGRPRFDMLEKSLQEFPSFSPTKIEGSFLVISDIHIPFYDMTWLERSLETAKDEHIKDVIIAGDFFDAKSVSSYTCLDKEHTLLRELQIGRDFFYEYLDEFRNVYMIPGNHDQRIAKYMNGELTLDFFFTWMCPDKKLHVSDFPFLIANETWRISHPGNYSRIPGMIPRKLSEKHHMNTMCGHTHYTSFCKDVSGTYECYEIGCLTDLTKTEYLFMLDKNNPVWNNGFATLKKDKATLYHEGNWTNV